MATAAPIQRSRASLPARSARSPSPPASTPSTSPSGLRPAPHNTTQHSTAQHSTVLSIGPLVQFARCCGRGLLTRRSGAQGGARGAEAARFHPGRHASTTPPPLPTVAPTRVPTVHSLPPSLAGDGIVARAGRRGRRPRAGAQAARLRPGGAGPLHQNHHLRRRHGAFPPRAPRAPRAGPAGGRR